MRRFFTQIALVAASVFGLVFFGWGPASAISTTPAEPFADAWIAVSPETGGKLTVGSGSIVMNYLPGPQPRLLNLIDFVGCTLSQSSSYLIKNYVVKPKVSYTSTRAALYCGTASSSGYLHIQAAHQTEWQARVTAAGGGAAWDDLMDFATAESLATPGTRSSQPNNKTCYSTPVEIYDAYTFRLKFVFNPTVVVSNNNRLVVTSYPTTSANC